jgi:hypothetical protein
LKSEILALAWLGRGASTFESFAVEDVRLIAQRRELVMADQAMDTKTSENHRRPWQKPERRRLDAGSAEGTTGTGADAGVFS